MLLYLSETWKRNIDNGKVVGVILIDFCKAFDTVNHNILHQKMKSCGLQGTLLEWLRSYLTNRSQYVELNGKKSRVTIIEYGVPQGSLLGPHLFLVYVNDMSGCVTVRELHLYADDTTAFVIGNNMEEVIDLLNILARDIHNWCNKNKLTVHTGKSEVLIIQNKSFVGPLRPVKMGDTVLKYVTFSDVSELAIS